MESNHVQFIHPNVGSNTLLAFSIYHFGSVQKERPWRSDKGRKLDATSRFDAKVQEENKRMGVEEGNEPLWAIAHKH